MSTPYTVVIPHRNEEDNLRRTVADILSTQQHCAAIVDVEDSDGSGTSLSRHRGTIQAQTEIVITCDAHMRFRPGSLDQLADFTAAGYRRVSCLRCHHNAELSFDDSPYCAADLCLKVKSRAQFQALTARWRTPSAAEVATPEPVEVAAVMGACYAFSRELYAAIGSPWAAGNGWGCDEERLSVAARLVGGSVWLHPAECAHLYRAQSQIPYRTTPADLANVWFNRLSLLYYLPLPEALRAELRQWLERNSAVSSHAWELNTPQLASAAAALKNNQTVAWADYARDWLIIEPNPEKEIMTKNEIIAKLAAAHIPHNPKADKSVLMQLLNSPASRPEPAAISTARPYVDNLRVRDYGIQCRHCGAVSDAHRITNTYANGNRRRICVCCGLPFVTVPAFDRNPDAKKIA